MKLWTLHSDGALDGPDDVVSPSERLSWGRTVGLGMQHVVAMFGATFVFPLLMGLSPQLAIMMSGVATLLFLVLTAGKVPSYLGSSASFVGVTGIIAAHGGTASDKTGALFFIGVTLLAVGVVIHALGPTFMHRLMPPAVTGAVIMLIGFNLAPVVAKTYWPQDQWIALVVMLFVVTVSVASRGFLSRISIFAAVVVGYLLSWLADVGLGPITGPTASGDVTTHLRIDWAPVAAAPWFGLPHATTAASPGWHLPTFHLGFTLTVLPIVVALVAENIGHVKAVGEMTGENLDPYIGRAVGADGFATILSTAVGGAPTTTYAENIGVMAATRVYSTAAYVVAALTAIAFGFSPKFGAVVSAIPGGVLGGITVVLYGMIGLLGAKIWVEHDVQFGHPVTLVPLAAGIIMGVGNVSLHLTDDFELAGIALGTITVIVGYHLAHALAARARTAPAVPDLSGTDLSEPEDLTRELGWDGSHHS
ncbi:putative uracil permease [Mobilicoccus pelagius NBRC 104925]|uniref:Putative uracil permease n=1 Tax=Mobilicoccus pelagius NBRC 104925 TaxID=1089455 RepID=H5UMQ3_9MICO|nr:solute carrier family 23 protein [Mobilicoccus pelagius]GAB47011.1 putative uracil permease [Mobilicoccus pelagius NBRC 104925]